MSSVLVLNGPPGVGKTTVSALLAARLPGTVCIRGDDLRAFAPADARVHLGPGSTHRAAGVLAAAYLAMGASRVIVDYCFLDRTHVGRLVERLDPGVVVHVVTLWAPLAVVQARERARIGREPLGDAVEECWRAIDAEPAFADRIDTQGLDPPEVALRVERRISDGRAGWRR